MQGKVAQFNNLSRESTHKRKESEAALRRAVVGREEAEGELRRLREANAEMRRRIAEFEGRERKVGLRLEAKMVSFSFFFCLSFWGFGLLDWVEDGSGADANEFDRRNCRSWRKRDRKRRRRTIG